MQAALSEMKTGGASLRSPQFSPDYDTASNLSDPIDIIQLITNQQLTSSSI